MNTQTANTKVTVILVRSVSDTLQTQVEDKLFANLQVELASIPHLVNSPLIFASLKQCHSHLEGLSPAERALAFVLIAHSKNSSLMTPPRFWPFAPGFTVSNGHVAKTLSAIPFVQQGIYLSPAVLHVSDTRRLGLAHNVLVWIERRNKAIEEGWITSEIDWSWTDANGAAVYPWGLARDKQKRTAARVEKMVRVDKGDTTGTPTWNADWLGFKSEKLFHTTFRDRGDIHPHDAYYNS